MKLISLHLNEHEIRTLLSPVGPAGRHTSGLADKVVNQAIINASGRPGPRIVTGRLVENVHKERTGDSLIVGSDAENRGYPYPSKLETGEDGKFFPWLKPALEQVITLEN